MKPRTVKENDGTYKLIRFGWLRPKHIVKSQEFTPGTIVEYKLFEYLARWKRKLEDENPDNSYEIIRKRVCFFGNNYKYTLALTTNVEDDQ